jgi:hypothetical protein
MNILALDPAIVEENLIGVTVYAVNVGNPESVQLLACMLAYILLLKQYAEN